LTPAVLLAAGTSSRYGCGNKLLARFGGRPLLVHCITQLRPAARPIIVVTGHQASHIHRCLRQAFGHGGHVRCVHNAHYRAGMASSLRRGIAALPPATTKAFLCLGDMPAVDASLLRRLTLAWQPELDVVRPQWRGQPGHPVLIHARLFAAFNDLYGDRGAKAILARVPSTRQKRVPWHAGCLLDTDTPAMLRRAELQSTHINSNLGAFNTVSGVTRWK